MNGAANDSELQQLFLETTQKLAAITAELGVPGDEPTEKIVAAVRRLKAAAHSAPNGGAV